MVKNEFQVAAVCDLYRIFKGFLAVGEKLAHFLFTLKVEFLALEFHPVGVVHGLAGLDTQQYILHGGILTAQIVGIVTYNQRKAGLPGNPLYPLVHCPLLRDTMILKLQVEIVLAKDLGH